MARTKKTARRTDNQGHLPPLSAPTREPSKWGTAKQTFLQQIVLPEVQKEGARPGVVRASYKGTVQFTRSKESKENHYLFVTVYSTVHWMGSKESKEQTRCKIHTVHLLTLMLLHVSKRCIVKYTVPMVVMLKVHTRYSSFYLIV